MMEIPVLVSEFIWGTRGYWGQKCHQSKVSLFHACVCTCFSQSSGCVVYISMAAIYPYCLSVSSLYIQQSTSNYQWHLTWPQIIPTDAASSPC